MPAESPVTPPATDQTAAGARTALATLTLLNLLNYVDRYVPSAVKEPIKLELQLTDAETSYPLTAFVLVYMLASPVFGALADRWPKRYVIAGGVVLWSLATAGAALAQGFWMFLFARALVGVGEAAYATLSPALLADFYPAAKRNRALTWFYVAIPLGAAIGFAVGGFLGQHYGWRTAFVAVGLPGILAAVLVLRMPEPPVAPKSTAAAALPTWRSALPALFGNRHYCYAVGGYVLVTFAAGALADWYPTYLARHRGMDLAAAGTIVGIGTVVGGLGGTLCGGYVADWLGKHFRHPYFLLSGATMAVCALLAVASLGVTDKAAVLVTMTLAQFFLWNYNGPINAILVNSVDPGLRTRAFALSILLIHLFGDAISPPIVGALADATANLPQAMGLIPVALACGAAVWLIGWRRLGGGRLLARGVA